MTRALQIGVPAASSSMTITLRRSVAQPTAEGYEETLCSVRPHTCPRHSTISRWQMRHSVSHVRLNKEFLESGEEVDLLVLSAVRSPRDLAGLISSKE
jgi:hypothetical protein